MVTSNSNSITWHLDTDTPGLGVTQQQFPYTLFVSDEVHARYFLFVKVGNADTKIVSEADCYYRNYFSATQVSGTTTALTQQTDPNVSWCIPKSGKSVQGGPVKTQPVMHDRTGVLDSAALRWLAAPNGDPTKGWQ